MKQIINTKNYRIRNVFAPVFLLLLIASANLFGQNQNIVVVIIDGARYSETFGDRNKTYIPNMSKLADQGTIIAPFYNDSTTYTAAAIPALWSGTWTEVKETEYNGSRTNYSLQPSIFEYVRKNIPVPAEKCYYVIKYIKSLWLQSFHPNYGPEYWPTVMSDGNNDADVLDNTLQIMDKKQPSFLWVYLADVDHGGHSGNWEEYIGEIEEADYAVGKIWDKIQSHPFYKDNTTLFVTNDHGRHDDQHGGFKGHGCGCDGCRRIMFLGIGPQIKQNFVSTIPRRIPDMSTTIAEMFNINHEYTTGEYMTELFKETTTIDRICTDQEISLFPNPCKSNLPAVHF